MPLSQNHRRRSSIQRLPRVSVGLILLLAITSLTTVGADSHPEDSIRIIRLPPDTRGGHAYELTYTVPLPLDTFWQFKTDFDNTFLTDNRYILEHWLISDKDNIVITENRYTDAPNTLFRWKTRVIPERYRLEFELIDRGQHGHKFHYGFIQLSAEGQATQVTQVAYFDFRGAYLWSRYPWGGGMRAFLTYTAQWEQKTAVRLRHRYQQDGTSSKSSSEP